MSNANNCNNDFNFDTNPRWVLIQWLHRLCQEELMENLTYEVRNIPVNEVQIQK